MDKLQPWEVSNLIDVMEFAYKEEWEQTRMVMYLIAQVNSTKKINPKDVIKLPWDKQEKEITEISNNDIKRLRDLSKDIKKNIINKR